MSGEGSPAVSKHRRPVPSALRTWVSGAAPASPCLAQISDLCSASEMQVLLGSYVHTPKSHGFSQGRCRPGVLCPRAETTAQPKTSVRSRCLTPEALPADVPIQRLDNELAT